MFVLMISRSSSELGTYDIYFTVKWLFLSFFFRLSQFLNNYCSYSSDTWHLHTFLEWPLECSPPYLTLTYLSWSTDFVIFCDLVSFLVTIGPTANYPMHMHTYNMAS